jgi:phosphoglycerol transferase
LKLDTMTALTPARPHRPLRLVAAIAVLALLFGWLLARSMGLTPTIFADEWYYSRMARLAPLDQAMVPSYLYLWLFRASSACGTGFLDCVRGANALLFVGAAPFLYLSARQVAGRGIAAAIALLATLAPLNVYTAYFMPESSYYFGFSVLSWVALAGRAWPRAVHALAAGLVLGLMSLVKVHALFLLPSLCLYYVYLAWSEGGAWLRRAALALVLVPAGAFAVKFGLGWLLAGQAGLSLFGPFYGAAANSAGSSTLERLLQPFLTSARGHLLSLVLLNALPLAVLAYGLLRLPRRAATGPAALLRAYTLLMLGAAAGVTTMYAATLVNAGVVAEGLRLHLRYYSFTFPLLWMVAAGAGGEPAESVSALPAVGQAILRWALALLLSALTVKACFNLPVYTLYLIDGPEIAALEPGTRIGFGIAALQVLTLLLWALGTARARLVFLFLAVPATVLCGIVANREELLTHRTPAPADKAGIYARDRLPAADRRQITLAGTNVANLMRAQFHFDQPNAATLELLPDAPIELYQLPPRSKWLVVFGKHPLPPGVQPVYADPDFVVVKLDDQRTVLGRTHFSEPLGQGLVASAEGLSGIETFGRWSEAKEVVLHLNMNLPRKGVVLIKAMSFGDNAQQEFKLRSGGSSASFRITGSMQEVAVPFETDGQQRTLTIEVPHPVSPADYGNRNDIRKLGIGLAEIEIAIPGG